MTLFLFTQKHKEYSMLRLNKKCLMLLVTGCLCIGTAAATSRMPPLPPECHAADEAKDPEAKVNLYTQCLSGRVSLEDLRGGGMEDWQRPDIHFKRGNALFELGRYAQALEDYNFLIEKSGGHVWGFHQRGMTHEALGQDAKALADYNHALKLNSEAIDVRYSRGNLLARKGDYRKALPDLRFAAKESPKTSEFVNALAWLLATCPDPKVRDGKEAVQLADRVVSVERTSSYLDTLAAAHARTGDFVKAISTQKEVLVLAKSEKASAEALDEFKKRLDLYMAGKAYTEERAK
jgi:tetratricopeptide (TPR) repeat protein